MPHLWIDGAPTTEGFTPFRLDDPRFGSPWVFETLRTYRGRPFRLEAHLARLAEGARVFGLPCDLVRIAAEIEALSTPESKLNVVLTGEHRFVFSDLLDPGRVGAPIRVVTGPPPGGTPWIKHGDRLGPERVALEARVEEVLWTRDGAWTETNRSNVICVRSGVLWTAPADGTILAGVTRAALLDAARALGLPIREEPVTAGPCDELYACSTLKEMAPIVAIDGEQLEGAGPVGAAIRAEFRRGT